MEKLIVGLDRRSYSIWIGSGILQALPIGLKHSGFPNRVAIITNPTVNRIYGDLVTSSLVREGFNSTTLIIPDGEEFKSLATLEILYNELINKQFDRSCGLLALGGGVIGDITGFAAATFLRGIPFAQVPTTLLSQVDSSVGGKTGVNHPLGKNLVGAIYQPLHVHIDVDTLRTLPSREFSAGMSEVIKYGVIRDRGFFDWIVAEISDLKKLNSDALIAAVKRSCQIKSDVVENDEREVSLRAILNYGHTFGHAVEALAGYGQIRHGEAVAIGMVVAANVAVKLEFCQPEDVANIRNLLDDFSLPTIPPPFPLDAYLQAMGRDKKISNGKLRLILNRGIGNCVIHEVSDPEALFRSVLNSLHSG